MTQDDHMETITDRPHVVDVDEHGYHRCRDCGLVGGAPPDLPCSGTITDPALIRATDEPDERGDFPCCTDRTHKESLGGDSESGTYNRSNRPPAGPCADERTAPAPSSGAGLDLDALHETICDKFTGMAEVRQAADLLVAEVRRLTGVRAECERQFQAQVGLVAAETTRAESAEAEVGTLRARLAAVEAVHVRCGEGVCNAGPKPEICHECGVAWPCPTFAALAVTTGEGQ